MLNWIKELTQAGFADAELESDELHAGMDYVLPTEVRQLLSDKPRAVQIINLDVTGTERLLDEHELALS